jgi:hypothetical protein
MKPGQTANRPKLPSTSAKALATPNSDTGKSDVETFCYVSDGKSSTIMRSFTPDIDGAKYGMAARNPAACSLNAPKGPQFSARGIHLSQPAEIDEMCDRMIDN